MAREEYYCDVSNLQIDDERVVDLGKQTLLKLDVIDLFQVDDLCLFQRLQRNRLTI